MAAVILIGNGGHARDLMPTLGDYAHIEDSKDADEMDEGAMYVIGINDPQVRDRVRKQIGWDDLAWCHPTVYAGPECSWGPGTHINYGVMMTRTKIGHHVTVAPGVTICGDVRIGDRVFIGAGAVIKNFVTIGDDAFIRMGSIVTRDVAPGERF